MTIHSRLRNVCLPEIQTSLMQCLASYMYELRYSWIRSIFSSHHRLKRPRSPFSSLPQ